MNYPQQGQQQQPQGARPVNCPSCNEANYIGTIPPGEVPLCRACNAYLPWIVDVTDVTFMDELKTTITTLIDFWAPWCGPCMQMKPIVEHLAQMYPGRLKVVMANADVCFGMAQSYQVSSYPTILVGRQGQVFDVINGAVGADELNRRLSPYV